MKEEQSATLAIQNRNFEVDMSQQLTPQRDKANLTMTEVKGCLTLPMKSKYGGWKKVPPKGDFDYEIVITGNPDDNQELCAECFSAPPITCKIQGSQQRASKGTFHVETCNIDLDLYFDSSKVKDCPQTLSEDRTFKVPFQLNISDGESSFKIYDYILVTVKQFTPALKFQFNSDYSDNKRLVFSTGGGSLKQVGMLCVSHNAKFKCAPDVEDAQFKLLCTLKNNASDVGVDSNERNDLLLLKTANGKMDNTYSVKSLKVSQCIDIPVLLDMRNVNNPASLEHPDIYTPTIFKNECSGCFEMYRNTILTKRKTCFSMPKREGGIKTEDITMCNHFDLGELFLVQKSDIEYILQLSFINECDATDVKCPNASVLVWNAKIDSVDGDVDRILTRNGKSLKDIFRLRADTDHWALNPKRGNKCSLEIKLNAGDIEGVIPDASRTETYACITLHLSYHAIEDVKGEYFNKVMNGQTAELKDIGLHLCDLKLCVKKQPQSEWLCVDFGTSAVVAAFARDTLNDRKSLIDLKRLKGYLLDSTYGKGHVKNSNTDEDDNLISSTACFNNDIDTSDYRQIDGAPESFKHYPVWFSPSANDIWKDYMLPCLKTIIGYKHLPNIFTEDSFKKFRYKCGENTVSLINDDGERTPLMEVGEVSKIIYRQLFKYYLSQRFGRNGQLEQRIVNKLVLSVPNTFTPLNIQAVKDLARDSMPRIYPEYLHTISESDAVACYYVSHQKDFLDSLRDEEKKQQLYQEESVLVYDMGAGTLDLTWFVKKTERDELGKVKHVDVDIKGKLGVSKAGNYLDYELATILMELYEEKSNTKSGRRKNNDSDPFKLAMLLDRSEALRNISVESQDRIDLKAYVKELKKKLSDPDAIVPRLEINGNVYIEGEQSNDGNTRRRQGVSLKMSDILENSHFKAIITEMTQGVLNTFGHRYGDEQGKLDIDVLIFSGRSTSLKAIREGVKEHISNICHEPEELLYADLCAGQLSSDIQQPANMDNSLLKTVVTQGALAYATMFSRNDSDYRLHGKKSYASFGLVKYNIDRSFEYVPLIDECIKDYIVDEKGIIESEKYKVCTRNLTQVDLVQSYSSHVEDDYASGNFDTISKLCEMPCQGLQDFEVQLIMNTQSDDAIGTTLTFKVGQGCNSLDPHDDFNNLSLRKSLWPVIFDNGENPNL